MQSIQIIQHSSAEEIARSFHSQLPGNPEDWETVCSSPTGEQITLSFADVITQIKSQRVWAYSNPAKREIHTWWAANAPKALRFQALAHELGHILYPLHNPLSDPEGTWSEEIREEEEVESFATQLYQLALKAGLVKET